MRVDSKSPILARMNDLEPQAARQPFWGPNAKMMALSIVFSTSLAYAVGWGLFGGPNGWLYQFAFNFSCRYLTGNC